MLPEIIQALREVQLPFLAVLLLLAAVAKTTRRAAGTGLAVLVPQRLRRPSTVATGLLELALAAGLLGLSGALGDAARLLTAVVFAASVLVLVLVRRRDPEAGCGCFGGLSRAPVGWRTLTRPGLLAVAALTTLGLEPSGWQVLASAAPSHAGVAGAQLLVLALLSPELRGMAARAARTEPCGLREVPLHRTMRVLRGSEVWRVNESVLLGDEPEDVWRQGCWRFLRYDGMRHGQRVDVVYAVRTGGERRTAVRAVLADRHSGVVVASFGAVAQTELPGPPRKLPPPREAARASESRHDEARAAESLRAAREHPAGRAPAERGTGDREPDGREPAPTG